MLCIMLHALYFTTVTLFMMKKLKIIHKVPDLNVDFIGKNLVIIQTKQLNTVKPRYLAKLASRHMNTKDRFPACILSR